MIVKNEKRTFLALSLVLILSVGGIFVATSTIGVEGADQAYDDGTVVYDWNETKDAVIAAHVSAGITDVPNLMIPDTVTIGGTEYKVVSIANNAFANQPTVYGVTIGANVETIGYAAFNNCSNVTFINMENSKSLKSIGSSSFTGTAVKELCIPENLETIEDGAICPMRSLESITVNEANTHFKAIDGVLYDYDVKTLIQYPICKTDADLVLPSTVTRIGYMGAYACENLLTVTLDNETILEDMALTMCTNLKTMTIKQVFEPTGNGLLEKEFSKDGWYLSNITINFLIIDSTRELSLAGINGDENSYLDLTDVTVNTTGGNFQDKDGNVLTGADRAGNRFEHLDGPIWQLDTTRIITVVSDPSDGGKITGGGKIEMGTEATLTATANDGFEFGYWDDDKTSTDPVLKFTVSEDVYHTAHFDMVVNCVVTIPTDATFELRSKNKPVVTGNNPLTFPATQYNYYKFYLIEAESKTDNKDGTTTYEYIIAKGDHYFSVSGEDYVTYNKLFTKSSAKIDETVTKTMLMPEGKTSTTVDRSVVRTLGDDVGGILVSANAQNHLTMEVGDTQELLLYRQWQAVKDTMSNYFIEPKFNYTIMDLNGNILKDVISITDDADGALTCILSANKVGTAVVVVTYDAMTLHDLFFGATWPELSCVFVVDVVDSASGDSFDTGMVYPYQTTARPVDAEFDYFYYYVDDKACKYSFTPASGTSVTVYNPILGSNSITGFKERSLNVEYSDVPTITVDGNGTYTIWLTEGRNVVKMVNNGVTQYQILTAMPFDYVLENLTDPEIDCIRPGDQFTLTFVNTHNPDIGGIFNSKGKLAGIYNSNATIYYEDKDGNRLATGTQPQYGDYFFLTHAQYQSLTATVPAAAADVYTMYGECIVIGGYDGAADHRTWMWEPKPVSIGRISFLPDIEITLGEITVTFDANGGSVSPESKDVICGDTYGDLPTPSKFGFKFDGWYLDGEKITADSIVTMEKNQTLTAQWSVDIVLIAAAILAVVLVIGVILYVFVLKKSQN